MEIFEVLYRGKKVNAIIVNYGIICANKGKGGSHLWLEDVEVVGIVVLHYFL